jgi:hypothetical protein
VHRIAILLILAAGCSFGLAEERNLQSRLAHQDAAEMDGMSARMVNLLTIPPEAAGDGAQTEVATSPALRGELAVIAADIRERASRTRFRCAVFHADHAREREEWAGVEPGSVEDEAHQAAYASMVFGNKMSDEVKGELHEKLAGALADGLVTVGREVGKRLPWWMRWGFYLAVAGLVAYGLLLLVAAYAVVIRRIAARRRVAFEQLDDVVERTVAGRTSIELPPEARAEHEAVNAKRKREGVR